MTPDRESPRLRPGVELLPVYRSGPPVPPPPGRPVHRSSLNESWYPPLPSVLAAIGAAAGRVNRYPDLYGGRLASVLAERLDRPPDEVVVGPGSNALLLRLLAAACGPGDEVVYAWRSFEAYPVDVQVAGAVPVPVPLTPDLRHDLPAMAAAVGPRTRAVLLCSPNNPTGPVLRTDQVEEFLRTVPEDLLVVLDEAYRDFSRDPVTVDGVELGRRRRNVVSLRTFSKAHGLAGLRVGYAVAPPRVTEAVRALGVPFMVPELAQAAALASLQAEAELAERVDGVVAERERILAGLRAQGWDPPESGSNFVWLPLGAAAAGFGERCAAQGLLVRVFDGEGVRCTVGPQEVGDLLLELAGRG